MKINLDKKLEISSQIKNKYYTKIYFSFYPVELYYEWIIISTWWCCRSCTHDC